MTPYFSAPGVTLYCGDAVTVLRELPEESVDFIFTDPPYGHNNNNGDLIHRWEAALGRAVVGVDCDCAWLDHTIRRLEPLLGQRKLLEATE